MKWLKGDKFEPLTGAYYWLFGRICSGCFHGHACAAIYQSDGANFAANAHPDSPVTSPFANANISQFHAHGRPNTPNGGTLSH